MANFNRNELIDVILIQPKLFPDDRGCFSELFRKNYYEEKLGKINWCQENVSISKKGVVRGLHYQIAPRLQNKLVTVLHGRCLDIAVDIRTLSPTFGNHYARVLSGDTQDQLFIPAGFAHGFLALSEEVVFYYKVDTYYSPECERGIFPGDPTLNLPWPIDKKDWILSKKDEELPLLKDAQSISLDLKNNFLFDSPPLTSLSLSPRPQSR